MTGCRAFIGWNPALGWCGKPPIALLVVACLHEHVSEAPRCAGCAAELQRCDPATLFCKLCDDAARQPHRCRPHIIIRWDSGEVTRTEGSEWVTDLAGASRC